MALATFLQTFAAHPLHRLNPAIHPCYADLIAGRPAVYVPADVQRFVRDRVDQRNVASESELPRIDAEIVAATWWYVLRPEQIARQTLRFRGWSVRHPLSVQQAAVVLAAIAEAGYPLARWMTGHTDSHPMPGIDPKHDAVIWESAYRLADAASTDITYVSLGDARGWMPRDVQVDEPGSMHPQQKAALTLGPADDIRNHDYMRRHTRLLLRVRGEGGAR